MKQVHCGHDCMDYGRSFPNNVDQNLNLGKLWSPNTSTSGLTISFLLQFFYCWDCEVLQRIVSYFRKLSELWTSSSHTGPSTSDHERRSCPKLTWTRYSAIYPFALISSSFRRLYSSHFRTFAFNQETRGIFLTYCYFNGISNWCYQREWLWW